MHDKSTNKFTNENIVSIPELSEVYELYITGANNKGNNPIFKPLLYVFLSFIFVLIISYFIIKSFQSNTPQVQQETNIQQQETKTDTENKPIDLTALSLVSCDSFNKYLYCSSTLEDIKYYLDTNVEELKSSLENLQVETKYITAFNLINFYLKNEYILKFFKPITIKKEQNNEQQSNSIPKNNLSIF